MEAIQYKGLDLVNQENRLLLDKLSSKYYEKIKRSLHNEYALVVHVKRYEGKSGGDGQEKKKAKYSIAVRAVAPTKIFEASAADWDFARTLHKVFKGIELEIEHHFKKS